MIPNAMTSTGPYAGLWSHLKSIDHTIERIVLVDSSQKLSELDKDRLMALQKFLKGGIEIDLTSKNPFEALLSYKISAEPEYSSAIDLRSRINDIPEFNNFLKKAKKGYDEKIKRLIDFIDNYLKDAKEPELFQKKDEKEEFVVLRSIIHSLLSDAEFAMRC
ncbi:MAG TPA: hypothetical protein VMU29_00305 [Smithella sp.]|nr:hypothetical protein [Smithella sp.]